MTKKLVEALPNLPKMSNASEPAASKLNSYFSNKNQTLTAFLGRISQMKHWQALLTQCLPEEKKLFEHCFVVTAKETHLMIIAENPHWHTRLRFLTADLLKQLKRYPGYAKLTAIYCKVGSPIYHLYSLPKKKPFKGLTISENTARQLNEAANKISHPNIQNSLKKLAARFEKIE